MEFGLLYVLGDDEMSRSHIKLTKLSQDENIVKYEIFSFDFNSKFEWEKFGTIEINIKSGSYIHKDNYLWEKHKIFPITFFETPIEERKQLSETKFKEYYNGQYALDVLNFIKSSIETNTYPDEKSLIR
jgi:hypothetical protein